MVSDATIGCRRVLVMRPHSGEEMSMVEPTTGPDRTESAAAPASAPTLERLQRELAETRSALQNEAAQLGQLQDTLEAALQVSRGVRIDPHTRFEQLAEELLESAQREAEAIRERATADVRELRASAESDLDSQRRA